MRKTINIFKQVLSNKKVTVLILTAIVISRTLQLLYLFNTRNDMSYQIMAAQALYSGHGVSSSKISAEDISTVHYQSLIQWPPAFSVLFIPFYAAFNEHYLPAAIVVNILSAIGLIFFSRAVLKLLGAQLYLINLFSLITGFSFYYFYLKPCTDSTVIFVFVMAIYFTLLLLQSDKNVWIKTISLCITLLFCALAKYLYLPLVFIIPLFLLWKGFMQKQDHLKKSGSIVFACLFIGCTLFFLYQKVNNGSIGYIKEPTRGFYPENLLSAYPYIPTAFIKPESLQVFFNWSPADLTFSIKILQVLQLAMFTLLLVCVFKKFSQINYKKLSSFQGFIFLSLLISLTITGLLAWLSLRVAKEFVDKGTYWTYVQEPRYYGVIQLLLQFIVFLIPLSSKKYLRYIFCFFILLMLPEMFRGLIFTTNRIAYLKKEKYGWQQELNFQKLAYATITREIKRQKADKVVLTGSSDWMTVRAALYCHLPVFEDVTKLNDLSTINTKQPVLLCAIIRKIDLDNFIPFINSMKTKFVGSNSEFVFYTTYITPH